MRGKSSLTVSLFADIYFRQNHDMHNITLIARVSEDRADAPALPRVLALISFLHLYVFHIVLTLQVRMVPSWSTLSEEDGIF